MDDSAAPVCFDRYSRRLWLPVCAISVRRRGIRCVANLWVAPMRGNDRGAPQRKILLGKKVPLEILDSEAVRRAEPNLRAGCGGLRVVDDGVIYPPCAARHLIDTARRRAQICRTSRQRCWPRRRGPGRRLAHFLRPERERHRAVVPNWFQACRCASAREPRDHRPLSRLRPSQIVNWLISKARTR